MCGRFALSVSPEALSHFIGLLRVFVFPLRYNVAPTQPVVAVRAGPEGREATFLRWGLVPAWSREPRTRTPLLNARAETLFDASAFRTAARRRRCLVPASGFYEWGGPTCGPGRPAPLLFRPRSGELLALAGLWERWQSADPCQPPLETCTLITTTANGTLRNPGGVAGADPALPFHDRMPVILAPADWDRWLDPAEQDPARLAPLLVPAPDDLLVATPASRRVNAVRNDDPDCLVPDPPEPVQGGLFDPR